MIEAYIATIEGKDSDWIPWPQKPALRDTSVVQASAVRATYRG